MIGRLHGVLVDRNGTDVIVDCAGVGYLVTCSAHTLSGYDALSTLQPAKTRSPSPSSAAPTRKPEYGA